MLEHDTHEGRRVIDFARDATLYAASSEITSMHVLIGLRVDESSRAHTLFRLRQLFSAETARPLGLKPFPAPKNMHRSDARRRIFVYAAEKAKKLNDYWIDTDHLVLGILRKPECPVTSMLNQAGLQIDRARRETLVWGQLWRRNAPIPPLGMRAGFLYLPGIVRLIEILTQRGWVLRFLL